jgi:DNA-binding transcriptional LysR family regulator
MELTQLRYFVTIAETLSFTGAAELVHVSQPALSYQMRRLEDELGTQLFHRSGRRISLTSDGEIFLPLARSVLSRASDAVRLLKDRSGVETGDVRLGANPSVGTYLMPTLLASFHEAFPRVRVELAEGGDLELQRGVYSGSLDFAVVTAPGSPQSLDVVPLGSEDVLVTTSLRHRLAERGAIDLSELAFDDFVLPTNAFNLATQVIDACRRAGFEPRVAYQAGSIESAKNFVRHGLGVSMLPSLVLGGLGREGLAVLEVQGGLTRELNLIRSKDRTNTRAAQVLLAHVRARVVERMKYPVTGEARPQ